MAVPWPFRSWGLLLLIVLASCFTSEAFLKKRHITQKHDGSVQQTKQDGTHSSSKDDDQDDDDDDDDDDDESTDGDSMQLHAVEKTINPHKKEEERLNKEIQDAKKKRMANKQQQIDLKLSLREVSNPKRSDREIDASAKKVANETESPAMGKMLGSMWKDMRMFEVPFYAEHVEEEIHRLKQEETKLLAEEDAAKQKLADAKKRWKTGEVANVAEDKAELSQKGETDKKEDSKDGKAKKTKKADSKKEDDSNEEKDGLPEDPVDAVPTDQGKIAKRTEQMSFWAMNNKQKESALVSTFVYLIFGLLVGWIYNYARTKNPTLFVPAPAQKGRSDGDFSNGLFGCFSDMKICVQGTCCPHARWANTLDNPDASGKKVMSYWKAFLLCLVLGLLNIYTYGISLAVLVLLGVYYRQKLRKSFDLENGTPGTWFKDLLSWCCCTCCAIIQEARETRETRLMP